MQPVPDEVQNAATVPDSLGHTRRAQGEDGLKYRANPPIQLGGCGMTGGFLYGSGLARRSAFDRTRPK
jgi:hypothetical protein